MLSIEILMETIIVSGAVLQQKRRRSLLSGCVATVKKRLMAIRETNANPHALVPRISDRDQEWIDRFSQLLNQHRQWIRKIAIFALAEFMVLRSSVQISGCNTPMCSTLFSGAGDVTTSSECRGERGATRLVRWPRTRDHPQANHSFSRADWLTPRSRAQAWLPQRLRREMG